MVGALLMLVIIPMVIGIINFFTKKFKFFTEITTIIGLLINAIYICTLFGYDSHMAIWLGLNMELSIYTNLFNVILMLCLAVLSIIVVVYSLEDLKETENKNYFYSYLMIGIALCNGVFLAGNLITLLFFVVALVIPLFGMILISGEQNRALSKKAFIVFSITSLCLMFGASIVEIMQKELNASRLIVDADKIITLGFLMIFIDILSKSSFFPFQFWSTNLTNGGKVSHSLVFPTLILGLIGTYMAKVFLVDTFNLSSPTIKTAIYVFLSLGIIILTVLGFLQKDFRKLIAYIFATQMGFSLMSITVGGNYGIIGGVLNTINTVILCLGFYMISGMANYKNKIITGLYLVFTLSFVGIPIFGGYFSHKLVYNALYNENVFYFAVLIISTFVLGLALTRFMYCLFKKENDQLGINYMELTPTIILAVIIVLLAVFNNTIVNLIAGAVGIEFTSDNRMFIDFITFLIILQLIVIQLLRFRKKESEYFNTTCLSVVNNSQSQAEKINIYDIIEDVFEGIAVISKAIDNAINWFYDKFLVNLVFGLSKLIKRIQTGNFSTYVILSVLGFVCILLYVLR